jgi:hypothetical protein
VNIHTARAANTANVVILAQKNIGIQKICIAICAQKVKVGSVKCHFYYCKKKYREATNESDKIVHICVNDYLGGIMYGFFIRLYH